MNNLIVTAVILAIGIGYGFVVFLPLFGLIAAALKALRLTKENARVNVTAFEEPAPVI